MHGFDLLLGHLIGDYILQNDWMASNKSNPWPGLRPCWSVDVDPSDRVAFREAIEERNKSQKEWPQKSAAWRIGNVACFVHCVFYTLAIALTCWAWLPLWGYAVVFALHYPVDRWRLARIWMERVSGQKAFANGPLSPWSIIIVDNIAHLGVLYAVAKVAL